jgi:hypothetical protein
MANRRPASDQPPGGGAAAAAAPSAGEAARTAMSSARRSRERAGARVASESTGVAGSVHRGGSRTRSARLRLVHIDPFSVMRIAFLLSIAAGIIAIVAVLIIWGVLGAAGVWDSINSSVQQTVGSDSAKTFNITDYIGTGRMVGFTMIASVIDVVVITALATLGAFVYNLAATLLGGIELTFEEDR